MVDDLDMQKPLRIQKKRRKSFFARFLAFIVFFVVVIVCMTVGWILYARIDRVSPFSVISRDFSLLVHTNNVYKSVNSILDLHTADRLLEDKPFSDYKKTFSDLRQSPLRLNKYVRLAASCRADVALYRNMNGQYNMQAVADVGIYSALTRAVSFLYSNVSRFSFARIKDLSYVKSGRYFVYTVHDKEKGTSTDVYFCIHKNLVLISLNPDQLTGALAFDHLSEYNENIINTIEEKTHYSFKIVTGAKKIALQSGLESNPMLTGMVSVLSEEDEAVFDVNIGDDDFFVQAHFPLESSALQTSSLAPLLSRKTSKLSMLSRFTNDVQYYTLLNIGSLEDIKNAIFPVVQESVDVNSIWEQGQSYSHKLFKSSIEDLLFSWTGREFAVLGIEGSDVPVFVLQIGDEAERKKAFKTLEKSILIKTKSNLIVDGVRLPCIQMPAFFSKLLHLFKIELPKPYYLVYEGYIYFSESPENLAILYNRYRKDELLSKSDIWKRVSEKQENKVGIGLYYNLARSVPFFLKADNAMTKLFKLYNIGRCDFAFDGDEMTCLLHACAIETCNDNLVQGFPVPMERESDYVLYESGTSSAGRKSDCVFWVEDDRIIKSLGLSSLSLNRLIMDSRCYICPCKYPCRDDGALWAVTDKGNVYLLTSELGIVTGFPVKISGSPSGVLVSSGTSITIKPKVGMSYIVKDTGSVSEIVSSAGETDGWGTLEWSAYIKNKGISYPDDDLCCIARMSDSGKEMFFALGQEGMVYKMQEGETYSSVQISALKESNEMQIFAEKGRVYVSGSSNMIFAFNQNLELVSGFPVTGRGRPVLSDIDGDGVKECVVLGGDKKVYAWKIR